MTPEEKMQLIEHEMKIKALERAIQSCVTPADLKNTENTLINRIDVIHERLRPISLTIFGGWTAVGLAFASGLIMLVMR